MYPKRAESSQSKRVGVDEQLIKFKSSQNSEVMKKFIRSKIDNTEKSNRSSPNNLTDPNTSPSEPSAGATPEQSPPDTLESPNDNSPAPSASVDSSNEYPSPAAGEAADGSPARGEGALPERSGEQPAKPPESTIMCRDFVRGTCKRPGTCKYAHKCDTSQLVGVYTFCRNFQNKVCTLPNCKYVHASIFEEQYFYRTGKLPAHVLAPKGPTPAPSVPPENRVEIPTSFATPPPPLPHGLDVSSPMYQCVPSTSLTEPRVLREEFNGTDSADEPPPKKCKYCGVMNIRLDYHLSELEKKKARVEEWRRKSADIDRKKEKMIAIIMGFLNLARNRSSSYSSVFNMVGVDKTKILLEQLAQLSSTNRMPSITEDARQGNYGMMSVLAQLLSDFQRQCQAGDVGRKE